ncbi:MAG: hypothetical protein PHF86_09465 [Candidatus Nanoarchaeia archaeon]|jgi:hypothetical protein|nr:hypothetical protein [Candidatus Nanoarchaeia archaeon]
MKTKDFYQQLSDVGLTETRIPPIVAALNDLHSALARLDSFTLQKLKAKYYNSLDIMFEASQDPNKKIVFRKPPSLSVFTPRKPR